MLQKNHCKKEKLQKDDWTCYECKFLIQISYSNSNSLVNLYCFLIQYLRGTEDRCNLVSHYQRVSNQFQLVCSVWLWELCEKVCSQGQTPLNWFCKYSLLYLGQICTGVLSQSQLRLACSLLVLWRPGHAHRNPRSDLCMATAAATICNSIHLYSATASTSTKV